MTAPLPPSETRELPLTFVATTVAQIDCPHWMLYGEVVNRTLGIVQDLAFTVARTPPLQIAVS